VAIGLGSLRGILQIGGDLLRDLLISPGIGLQKLLERAYDLGKRRKAAIVQPGLADATHTAAGGFDRQTGPPDGCG
jgi:hypothetical protein